MAVPSPSSIKADIRREVRARRKAFTVRNRRLVWSPGARDFEQWFDRGAEYASYRPMGSEADPAAIERIADGDHLMVRSYPRIDDDGRLRFYGQGRGPMRRSAMGIDEPGPDAGASDPSIVFVPLVAFDRSGTRLGQGGGHYDGALAALRDAISAKESQTAFIGVAWSVQEVPSIPREAWDVPLDAIVTEKEWIVPE